MFNILKKLIQRLFSRQKKETRSSQRASNVKVYTNKPSEHLDECSEDETLEEGKNEELGLEEEREQTSGYVKETVEISSDNSSDNDITEKVGLESEEVINQITVSTEESETVETEEVAVTSLDNSGEDEVIEDDKKEELEPEEESEQSSVFVEEPIEISSDESSENEITEKINLELEEKMIRLLPLQKKL